MTRQRNSKFTSVSVEDYIKTIYHLEQRQAGGRVKSKDIAVTLGIAQPSVTGMLKNLSSSDLIEYQPYQGVTMTDEGREMALRIIRKHRLIEVFLIETLGLSWDEVHEEAEQLEHAMSDRVTDRLEQFLGFPSFDPHGDPIPDREGRLPKREAVPLASVAACTRAIIARILDQSPEILRYLANQGLTPGVAIKVRDIEPFEGPLEVLIDGEARHLSHALARRILVMIEGE